MKILLTGCAGFIGMHAALGFLARGQDVIGIDNLNSYYDVSLKKARLAQLELSHNFKFYQMDIVDYHSMDALFKQEKPGQVVHLAAQAGVRHSLSNPQAYIDSNIQGFMNLLEACRCHLVKHLVYASSSSVYGNSNPLPLDESQDTSHPISLYAATKKTNELMAHVYSHLHNLPTTGLRFFTVYGPWGRPDMAFFKFTEAILTGKPIDIYNNGEMTRDFTYIDDIVEGIVRITDAFPTTSSNAPYHIFNMGNNTPTHLTAYINALENELGIEAQKNYLPIQPGDVLATDANVEALYQQIGFKPNTPIAVGIRHFVHWYRHYYKR